MATPVPRAIEVALTERALALQRAGMAIAVRSSAVGEGGERTFAGQFTSYLNVPVDQVVDAYKRVVAGVSVNELCSIACLPDCRRWKARWRCSASE